MTAPQVLKERILTQLERLSSDQLQEVMDFVGYLVTKQGKVSAPQTRGALDPRKDPLLKFIGGVSHGRLAQNIDEELYGE